MSESWIVGINPVEGALSNDAERVRELLVEQGQRNARVQALAERAKALNIPVHHRPREQLERLAGEARHQSCAAARSSGRPVADTTRLCRARRPGPSSHSRSGWMRPIRRLSSAFASVGSWPATAAATAPAPAVVHQDQNAPIGSASAAFRRRRLKMGMAASSNRQGCAHRTSTTGGVAPAT